MLGSNLPLDDVPVGVVQVCTGTMHVQTVGRQQPVKKLDICQAMPSMNQGNLIAHNFNKIG